VQEHNEGCKYIKGQIKGQTGHWFKVNFYKGLYEIIKKCDVKGSEIKKASAVNGCTKSPVNKDQTGLIVM